MAKGERDWAQLDAFEAEYHERLESEKKRGKSDDSQYLTFLNRLARGRETFWSDEVTARDGETGRLFALRTKIINLREKLGVPEEKILLVEVPFAGPTAPGTARAYEDRFDPEKGDIARKKGTIRYITDPAPPDFVYPVSLDELKAVFAELPPEHAQTVHEVRLSNQKRTGADGDWLDGEIRLHCLVQETTNADGNPTYRRQMGRSEGGADVERWGGSFVWEGNKLFSLWPRDVYKTFVLRRVLLHEIAHGVAELPGNADKVRRAGSIEKFCEQYAENFYRPPGRSVRLGY